MADFVIKPGGQRPMVGPHLPYAEVDPYGPAARALAAAKKDKMRPALPAGAPQPVEPHPVIKSTWVDLFAHMMDEADRDEFVERLKERRVADRGRDLRAARELSRMAADQDRKEAAEAAAAAMRAAGGREALRSLRRRVYALDEDRGADGFVSASAAAAQLPREVRPLVTFDDAGDLCRGFDIITAAELSAQTRAARVVPTVAAAPRQLPSHCDLRRAFYDADPYGNGYASSAVVRRSWATLRGANPPDSHLAAGLDAAPELALRDLERLLLTNAHLPAARAESRSATSKLVAAARELQRTPKFDDAADAVDLGSRAPLVFRDQLRRSSADEAARRAAAEEAAPREVAAAPQEAAAPTDVVPGGPRPGPPRFAGDGRVAEGGRRRSAYVDLSDGGALREVRFGVRFPDDELPAGAARTLAGVVRCGGATVECAVPVLGGESDGPVRSPIVRLSAGGAAPLRVNVFAAGGAPLCSANLAPEALAAAGVVELAARPSFRGAPAAEVVFEIREVKGNP